MLREPNLSLDLEIAEMINQKKANTCVCDLHVGCLTWVQSSFAEGTLTRQRRAVMTLWWIAFYTDLEKLQWK